MAYCLSSINIAPVLPYSHSNGLIKSVTKDLSSESNFFSKQQFSI